MKKITLVFILFFCTLFGYSQEGFEGSSTSLPAGWNAYHTGSGTTLFAVTTSASAVCAGSNAAVVNRQNIGIGNSSKDYLVTNQLAIPANAQIRFTTRQSFPEDLGTVYKVMLSTNADPSVLADYVSLQSYTENEMNPSAEYNVCKLQTVDIPTTIAAVGQNVHIAFVKEVTATPTTWGERWALDDISLVSKCMPTTNSLFISSTADNATIRWTIPTGSTTWNLEYAVLGVGLTCNPTILGLTATSPGITVTGNVVTYVLSNLDPNTQYQFSVQNVCGPGNVSECSPPFNFNTLNYGAVCADPIQVTALPYQNSDNTGNFLDLVDVAQGTGCGAVPAATNYMGGNEVFYSYTAATTGLISVKLTPTGPNSSVFIYGACPVGGPCLAGVANTNSNVRFIDNFAVTAGSTYIIVVSSSATTQTVGYTLVIQQENCDPPVGSSPLPADITQTSATLNWTNPTLSTSWEVAVQTLGQPIPTTPGLTASTYVDYLATTLLTGAPLTAGTQYQYWVRAECSPGIFSAWAGPYPFNTEICDNANKCNYTFRMTDSANNGWQGAKMQVRQNNIVIAEIGPTYTTGAGPVDVVVGLCHNVPFDLYWSVAGSAPQQCKVAVLNSFGQTLFTKANGVSGQGQVVYSNVVDCLVPECDIAPINVVMSNLTTSGANVSWVAPATTSWDICVLPAGSPAPTLSTPDENTTLPPIFYNNIVANGTNPNFNFDISGLTPDTPYNVYVRVNCSPEHSPWSTVSTFTTVPTCPKPTIVNTSVTGITTISATFDWTNGSATDTKWQILLIPSETATLPTVLPAIDPIANPVSGQKFQIVDATIGDPKPFTINGLDPAQIYFYYIRTVCSDDNISTWAGPIYFNTVTCDVADKCSYKFLLTNAAGNSWNNGRMQVLQNGILIQTLGQTLVNNANGVSIPLCHNEAIQLFWSVAGTVPENIGITIISPFNDIIYTKPAGTGTPLTMLYNQLGNCTPPTCPKPLPLPVAVATIGTTTAKLTWTEQSTATQWEVFVTPFGSAPPVNGTALTATSSAPTAGNGGFYYLADLANGPLPFEVSGLLPSTVYQYYVRAICSSTDISTWTILNPIKFITKPINDECENAINALINPDWACNPSLNNPGNTLGATASLPTITGTGCGTTDDDVWYKFTATSTAHIISLNDILPTPNTATVTLNHMVLSGVCGTLVKMYCSTDTQSVATGLVVGQTYYIRVYTAGSTAANSATFNLCIGTPPPPATNDECATALPAVVNELSECLLTTPGNIIGATASTQAIGATNATNNPCFGTANDDVWFTFVANSGTEIVSLLNIVGTTTNLNHAIYSGTCGNLVRLNCSADNTTQTVTKNLVVGNTYYIRIWSNSSASQVVTFDLCVKPVSSCQNAAPFCGADVNNPYIYPNTTGLPDNSEVACLGSIPNPTYYTLHVDQTGDLAFNILQYDGFDATGNPIGASHDVDFVAWGPFDTTAACNQIAFSDCPTCPFTNVGNESFYPFGNIIDCSYSGSFTETLTINGAIAGQYYIILVTNFSNLPGYIRLVQTNFGQPNSGQTVCCSVDLGPDKAVCGDSVELNALDGVTDLNNVPGTYEWFLLPSTTPIPGATGSTYLATQSGTYKVQGACGLNPVDDEIIVLLSPPIVTTQPSDYRVCDDASNDGIGQFDLQTLTSQVLGTLDPALYTVSYHLTQAAAESETSVGIDILTPFSTVSTTIYIRVESNALETCYSVKSVNLVVIALPAPPAIPSITECEEDPIQTLIPVVPDGVDVEWFDAPVGGNIVLNPSWSQLESITFYAESISPNLDFVNTNPVTVTIPAGQTSATYTVPTLADSTTELPETFTVIGTITSGNTANTSSPSTGVINDTVAERIVNIAQPLILEGSPAIFNISISNPSDIDTVIDIETSNLTADLTDYTPPTVTSVTIPAGQTNVSISIPTLADAIAETDEQFQLKATVTSGNTTNIIVFANAIITETVSQPSLIVYGSNTVEGNLAIFNLCLTAPSSVDTVIVFNTSSGTAGTLGCRSATRTAVTLTINDTPEAPISGGDQTECELTPTQTLTATATAPTGATVVWYDALTGGNIVASPTLNVIDTVTYYAESELNGCVSLTRTPVTLTIVPLPLSPVSGGDQTVCESDPIQTLTATATAPTGATVVWYDALTGGNVVASPTLNTVTTVTYYAEAVGPAPTQCVNPVRTAVTLTINDAPEAPISGGDQTECELTPTQTLTATATAPTGATVVWYDALTGGNIVASPTLNVIDTVTYYAESELNGCVSLTRTPVTLTIVPLPLSPVSGGDQTVCESDPIQTLTATATAPTGATVVWYDALTGGNVVASPTLNTVTTVTYYAEAVGPAPTQCVNPVRTAVTLTINDTPDAPVSGGDIEQCVLSSIQTLTATATAPAGATVVWYNSLSGGSVVTTPTLNVVDTVTYYAESDLAGCVSLTRTPVVLTITDVPKFAIQGDCLGNDFTLKTDIEGALTYSWKDASDPTNTVLATSPTIIVKSPGTYTCTITNTDGCFTTENIAVSEVSCSIQKGISPKGVGPGDGLNDSFDLSTLNVSKLEIFNRYGSKVYSKDNYTNEWFGQSDAGNELPDGTYYYVIKLVNDPTQTGWIYINREQ